MSDKLVFDLAQEIEGSPNVFVRKDWINILDNQNQNYNNNQSILDTSQLSNSNKYMSYREAYLSVPFILTIGETNKEAIFVGGSTQAIPPAQIKDPDLSMSNDYCIGLKNWFGQIIHSFTLDYNGTTILQQTPFINMWNSFKLMTSLSLNDVSTQGATIGFYPDNPTSWAYVGTPATSTGASLATYPTANGAFYTGFSTNGNGTVNNNNTPISFMAVNGGNCFSQHNSGLFQRQQLINFDTASLTGAPVNLSTDGTPASSVQPLSTYTYGSLMQSSSTYFTQTWKSYIAVRSAPVNQGTVIGYQTSGKQFLSYNIVASIYLKHIHSFFNMCPLLKGVFMKMTMNLNNATSTITTVSKYVASANANVGTATPLSLFCSSVSVPVGGVNPVMIASGAKNSSAIQASGTVTLPSIQDATSDVTVSTQPLAAGLNVVASGVTTTSVSIDTATPAVFNAAFAAVGGVLTSNHLSANVALDNAAFQIGYTGAALGAGTTVPVSTNISSPSGSSGLFVINNGVTTTGAADGSEYLINITYRVNLSVGAVVLDQTLSQDYPTAKGQLSKSVYLYIPAYTFNPIFEQSYLSSPIKQIKYTDVYQYQILNVSATAGVFNNLLTNGIANIKSVLILPFYSANTNENFSFSNGTGSALTSYGTDTATSPNLGRALQVNNKNTGFASGTPVYQSPFDPAGTGPTSPLCALSNFNIQISGQNAIYNMQKYNFEQFNNQLYGQNAVNGGLTDGITSALIDRQAFDMEYCYYYVNVERMLPVEQSVPKSVQVLGQNYSSRAIDLFCFIEYGNEISIDALTGARV